ncbi:MAG: hypothetical protein WDW19_00130, partial [Neisseriaceae bacterium]
KDGSADSELLGNNNAEEDCNEAKLALNGASTEALLLNGKEEREVSELDNAVGIELEDKLNEELRGNEAELWAGKLERAEDEETKEEMLELTALEVVKGKEDKEGKAEAKRLLSAARLEESGNSEEEDKLAPKALDEARLEEETAGKVSKDGTSEEGKEELLNTDKLPAELNKGTPLRALGSALNDDERLEEVNKLEGKEEDTGTREDRLPKEEELRGRLDRLLGMEERELEIPVEEARGIEEAESPKELEPRLDKGTEEEAKEEVNEALKLPGTADEEADEADGSATEELGGNEAEGPEEIEGADKEELESNSELELELKGRVKEELLD